MEKAGRLLRLPGERARARKLAVSSADRTRKTGFARCPTGNYLITIIREEVREAWTAGDTGFRAARSQPAVCGRGKLIRSVDQARRKCG